uniref:Uncharacterized protein n=1 Tax=Anopheles farauti TaxID=69004 RepID=A0A182QPI4_9DIPT
MATFVANASKHGPVDPDPQPQRSVQLGEGREGMATGMVGSENTKKCNAKVSGGAAARRKGSGSGLEHGGGPTPPKPSGSGHPSSAHTLISYLFYLMCITALGASVYTNLRQSHVEDKLSSLVSIEARLSLVEAQVSDVYRRITLRKGAAAAAAATAEPEEETVSDVVRKISHQIAELPRMRRDLSALKVSRKDRQAAVQGGECMCPPAHRPGRFGADSTETEPIIVRCEVSCRGTEGSGTEKVNVACRRQLCLGVPASVDRFGVRWMVEN